MELLNRMKSRKFILTVVGIIAVTLFPEQADNIVTVIGFFVGAEGVADVVDRYNQTKKMPEDLYTEATEEVDKNSLVPGAKQTN